MLVLERRWVLDEFVRHAILSTQTVSKILRDTYPNAALMRTALVRTGSPLGRALVHRSAVGAILAGPSVASRRWTSPALVARRSFSSSSSSPPRESTIFALATPAGKAGVAVFRISGPAVKDVYQAMVFPHASSASSVQRRRRLPEPRRMVMRDIRVPAGADGRLGEVIDEGLVVYFEGSVALSPFFDLIQLRPILNPILLVPFL